MSYCYVYECFLLISLVHVNFCCHIPYIWNGPQSQTIQFGERSTFECVGDGVHIHWFVDGVDTMNMTEEEIREKGIRTFTPKSTYYYYFYSPLTSFLEIDGNCLNNSTEIHCVIFGCDSDNNYNKTSNKALLIVEANVTSFSEDEVVVSAVNAVQTGLDSLLISWSLLSTTSNNYTQSLRIEQPQNQTSIIQLSATDTSYSHVLNSLKECAEYFIAISVETHSCTGSYYNSTTMRKFIAAGSPDKAHIERFNQKDKAIYFKFNNKSVCHGQIPTTVEFLLFDDSEVQSASKIPLENATHINETYQSRLNFQFKNDTKYHIMIVIHAQGESSFSDPFVISTFEVEDLLYSIKKSELCLTCMLKDGTYAKGCLISLFNTETLQTVAVKIPIEETVNVANTCIHLLASGYYVLTVYDWKQNVSITSVLTRELSINIQESIQSMELYVTSTEVYSATPTLIPPQSDMKKSAIITGSTVGIALVIMLSLTASITIAAWWFKRKKQISNRTNTSRENQITTLQMNSAYEAVKATQMSGYRTRTTSVQYINNNDNYNNGYLTENEGHKDNNYNFEMLHVYENVHHKYSAHV